LRLNGRNEPVLLRDDEGGAIRLTLNRPQRRWDSGTVGFEGQIRKEAPHLATTAVRL
jgi:hypothetical protein